MSGAGFVRRRVEMLSLLSVCYWFPLDLNPVQLIICLGSYLVLFIFFVHRLILGFAAKS
jgi:hypothetical protein